MKSAFTVAVWIALGAFAVAAYIFADVYQWLFGGVQ